MTTASSSPSTNDSQSLQPQSVLEILLEPPLPLGKWLFMMSAIWLKSASEAFDSYFNQKHHPVAQAESFSRQREQNLDTTYLQQISVIPNSAHWNQVRKLSHNIATGVEQALKEWVMIAPNELSELRNYIKALSQNQMSDSDAVALIQNLEGLPSSHIKPQMDVREAIFPHLFLTSEIRELLIQRTTLNQQKLEPLLGQTPNQKYASSHAVEARLPASFFSGGEPPSDPLRPEDSEEENTLIKSEALSGYDWDEDSCDLDGEAIQKEDEIDEERLAAFDRAIEKDLAEAEASRYDPKYSDEEFLKLQEQWQRQLEHEHHQGKTSDPAELRKPRKPSHKKSRLAADELVHALRERYGVTQEEFAIIVGVRYNTINRWENGHVFPQRLAIERLKQLTEELGTDGKDLLAKHFPIEQSKQQQKRKKQSLGWSK